MPMPDAPTIEPVEAPVAGTREPALITARGLTKRFGDFVAVDHVDFDVAAGESFGFLGPNGAGKTSTMRMIGCVSPISEGHLRVIGMDPATDGPRIRARLGVVPQQDSLDEELTVRENLWMVTQAGPSRSEVEEAAFARFPRLGERRNQLAGTMSGGEQQMLAMSRALAVNPAVLLLDELSMGLAPLIVGQLYDIVKQIADEGVSILVVEQFARTVLGVADHAVIMQHGTVVAAGPPSDLEAELSAAYLGAST